MNYNKDLKKKKKGSFQLNLKRKIKKKKKLEKEGMIWYGLFILRREWNDRIKEMDLYEKWKITDFRNEIAAVILKLKKILETTHDSKKNCFSNKGMTIIFSFVC